MAKFDIFDSLEDLKDKSITVDQFCEVLDGKELLSLLQGGALPFLRRNKLCEFLGISESTLSSWVNDGKIPLTAKKAIALDVLVKHKSARIKELEAEKNDKDQFLIVRDRNAYKVCRFVEDPDKTQLWEVVAGDIPNLKDARLLSLPMKQQKALTRVAEELLDDLLDRTEGTDYARQIKDQQEEIFGFSTFVEDPKKFYVPVDLSDLFQEEAPNEKA